eukprot:1161308-Pelagomonas_calceolata.AAC.4
MASCGTEVVSSGATGFYRGEHAQGMRSGQAQKATTELLHQQGVIAFHLTFHNGVVDHGPQHTTGCDVPPPAPKICQARAEPAQPNEGLSKAAQMKRRKRLSQPGGMHEGAQRSSTDEKKGKDQPESLVHAQMLDKSKRTHQGSAVVPKRQCIAMPDPRSNAQDPQSNVRDSQSDSATHAGWSSTNLLEE